MATSVAAAQPLAPSVGPPPSPAGPVEESAPIALPPEVGLPPALQAVRLMRRPLGLLFGARAALGGTFTLRFPEPAGPMVVVSHPDHVRSLFTAKPELAPSMTSSSPLRPILGEGVLTSNPPEHMPRRKLLLPPFHGESIARYEAAIEQLVEDELDRWRAGEPFALSGRMQAVTLDVIMAGIFGVEGRLEPGSPEHEVREVTRRLLGLSEQPWFVLVELRNHGRREAVGLLRRLVERLDRSYLRIIEERRRTPAAARGHDVLSLLLATTDEDGRPLGDRQVRDELVTLVFAGHETTANSLAWAFERLTRTPAAHAQLRDAVRGDDPAADELVEATIHETMRSRPVIPMVGRVVQVPWRFGEHVVPAGTRVAIGSVLVHHREDLHEDPFAFRPERWLDARPGTYTWLPFGGGTRRCLGAAFAMAEQRIVLRAIVRRVDLEAVDPAPERAHLRNVTLLPRHGGRVVARAVA